MHTLLAPIQMDVLENVTAAAVADIPEVSDYRHIQLQIAASSDSSSGATIKVYGSYSETKPDFSASASLSNQYFPVSVKNLDTVANISGSTGITLGPSETLVNGYMVNTDALKWLAVVVSDVSGTVDISSRLFAAQTN
jgi:hypothetical protein